MNITVVPLLLTIQSSQLLKLWECRREWPVKPTTISVPVRETLLQLSCSTTEILPASNFSSFILDVVLTRKEASYSCSRLDRLPNSSGIPPLKLSKLMPLKQKKIVQEWEIYLHVMLLAGKGAQFPWWVFWSTIFSIWIPLEHTKHH